MKDITPEALSMLKNMMATLSSKDPIIIISWQSCKVYVAPFEAWSHKSKLAGKITGCKVSIEESLDQHNLVVAVPDKFATKKYFYSSINEPTIEWAENIRKMFPNDELEPAEVLVENAKANHKKLLDNLVFFYQSPVFAPFVKNLGGLEFFKNNKIQLIEIAEALISRQCSLETSPEEWEKLGYDKDIATKVQFAISKLKKPKH